MMPKFGGLVNIAFGVASMNNCSRISREKSYAKNHSWEKIQNFFGIVLVFSHDRFEWNSCLFLLSVPPRATPKPFSEVEYLTRRIGKFKVLPEEPATLAAVTEK